ncbi:hypothetical protein [Neorhodopirellula pilleata]|uniref:hypothetical protein n=1 Tax=Neorhodopirellula pilleata TaxID=2714738 RepID=UPI001E5D3F55|nr:hypothetical protein [Neorhodopirellula pilleata]
MNERSRLGGFDQLDQFRFGQRPSFAAAFGLFIQPRHAIERVGDQTLFAVEVRLLSALAFADAPIPEHQPRFAVSVVERCRQIAVAFALFGQPSFEPIDRQVRQRAKLASVGRFVELRFVVLHPVGVRSLLPLVIQERFDVIADRCTGVIGDPVLIR